MILNLLSRAVLAGLFSLFFSTSDLVPDEETVEQRAAAIHDAVLTIDTHVDTPLLLIQPGFDIAKKNNPRKGGGKLDFPRMKEGGLDAVFFAVFVGQGPRSSEGNRKAKNKALDILDAIHKAVKTHSSLAETALTPDDAYAIEKKHKRAIYIGMENGYPVGRDLTMVKRYYDLGVRYITLCHTRNNDICDSSTDKAEHNGVSLLGKKVIEEMNRLGMVSDVSHISDAAFDDVLKYTKAPVIASHSCARAICDNPRNLSDDMLRELAEKGGVIQMCILSDYVKTPEPNPERDAAVKELRAKYKNFSDLSDKEKQKARKEWFELQEKFPRNLANVSDVVDHIDHVVKVVGIEYVGIGTDFDGGGGVDGCFDVSELGNITIELVRRGYSEEQIRKIWAGNFMRVFREVEKIAGEVH